VPTGALREAMQYRKLLEIGKEIVTVVDSLAKVVFKMTFIARTLFNIYS
jgi:hypothetical protein